MKEKKIFLIIFLACWHVSCQKAHRRIPPMLIYFDHFEKLNGNIKEIIETTSLLKYVKVHESSATRFDENGIPIETRISSEKGAMPLLKYEVIHDDVKGLEVGATNDISLKTFYKIDTAGRLIKSTTYFLKGHKVNARNVPLDKVMNEIEFKYDKKGNMVEQDINNIIWERRDTIREKYNERNFLIEKVRRVAAGRFISARVDKELYEYPAIDKKNNWTLRIATIQDSIGTSGNERKDTLTRKITYY